MQNTSNHAAGQNNQVSMPMMMVPPSQGLPLSHMASGGWHDGLQNKTPVDDGPVFAIPDEFSAAKDANGYSGDVDSATDSVKPSGGGLRAEAAVFVPSFATSKEAA